MAKDKLSILHEQGWTILKESTVNLLDRFRAVETIKKGKTLGEKYYFSDSLGALATDINIENPFSSYEPIKVAPDELKRIKFIANGGPVTATTSLLHGFVHIFFCSEKDLIKRVKKELGKYNLDEIKKLWEYIVANKDSIITKFGGTFDSGSYYRKDGWAMYIAHRLPEYEIDINKVVHFKKFDPTKLQLKSEEVCIKSTKRLIEFLDSLPKDAEPKQTYSSILEKELYSYLKKALGRDISYTFEDCHLYFPKNNHEKSYAAMYLTKNKDTGMLEVDFMNLDKEKVVTKPEHLGLALRTMLYPVEFEYNQKIKELEEDLAILKAEHKSIKLLLK